MSLNVEALTKYVELASQDIITSGMIGGSETFAHMVSTGNLLTGIKGEGALLSLDVTVDLQDNTGCGRNVIGSITPADGKIKVYPLKDEKDICSKELTNTYFSWFAQNKGSFQGDELNEKFAQFVGELRAKKVAATLEKMFWIGDTTLTDFNLKKFDGLLKQKGGTPTATTGTDIVAQLQDAVSKCDVNLAAQDDFYIYIGKDTYNQYLMALANRNIFKPTTDNTIFGTNVKLMVVSGLTGTDKIVATRASNIKIGVDSEAEMYSFQFRYEPSTQKYNQDLYLATGITWYTKDEATVFSV